MGPQSLAAHTQPPTPPPRARLALRAKSGAFGAVEGVRGSRARLRAESGAFGAVLLGSEPASTVQVVGKDGGCGEGRHKYQKMTDTSRDYRRTEIESEQEICPGLLLLTS